MNLIENFEFIQAEAPWFFALVAFGLGAIVGSFLNVCIYRIPAGLSVVTPGSRCGSCGTPIKWYHNIPILSWVLLRGRAACCHAKFSIRYPAIELLTGLFFLWSWLAHPPLIAGIGMLFASILIATTFIDLDHMIIPLRFSIGGMFLGVLLSIACPSLHGVEETGIVGMLKGGVFSVIGVLVGSAIIYWIRLLAEIALGKEAMGEGDVMFMGCIGAFCGWQGAVFGIFGGATIGTILLIPFMIAARFRGSLGQNAEEEVPSSAREEDVGPNDPEAMPEAGVGLGLAVPFGPMLALGGWLHFVRLGPFFSAYLAPFVEMF